MPACLLVSGGGGRDAGFGGDGRREEFDLAAWMQSACPAPPSHAPFKPSVAGPTIIK